MRTGPPLGGCAEQDPAAQEEHGQPCTWFQHCSPEQRANLSGFYVFLSLTPNNGAGLHTHRDFPGTPKALGARGWHSRPQGRQAPLRPAVCDTGNQVLWGLERSLSALASPAMGDSGRSRPAIFSTMGENAWIDDRKATAALCPLYPPFLRALPGPLCLGGLRPTTLSEAGLCQLSLNLHQGLGWCITKAQGRGHGGQLPSDEESKAQGG